jgi:hypothetical protein
LANHRRKYEAALVRVFESIAEEDLPGSLVIVDQSKFASGDDESDKLSTADSSRSAQPIRGIASKR